MIAGFEGHLVSERLLEAASPGAGCRFVESSPAVRTWLRNQSGLGPASSLKAILEVAADPLVRMLGFAGPTQVRTSQLPAAARSALVGTLDTDSGVPVLLVVATWGERLDNLWRTAIVEASRCSATWCLLFNGTHLRLLDARAVYSRRYAQFELEVSLDDELAMRALWSIASADALRTPASGLSAAHRLILASADQRVAVSRSLRQGVLTASEQLLRALIGGRQVRDIDNAFEQTLTLVYRMVFLLFAEARSLVPVWHPVYRESYSLEVLCEEAWRNRSTGLWQALRATSRLAHAGCRAGDLRVTPFNGRLFAPARTPLADRASLDDEAVRQSLLALATRLAPDREARERISYRDLGVEQIGAVYETLLDYTPHVDRETVSLRPGSGIRKATGTFYTPQAFVRYLVRRTLHPLVNGQTPERILDIRVLDPAMGSGAFLVGACAYLADAYETALVQSGGCHGSDIGAPERAAIRRRVAERCVYGVDLNPMAVQLGRLSLWLSTLAADRPLSFLDHHLVTGDSLLGAWLTCLRKRPGSHRTKEANLPLFKAVALDDAVLQALPIRFTLAQAASDTPEQIRAKERALAGLRSRDAALSKWRRVADLWCARWFTNDAHRLETAFPALADAILSGIGSLPEKLGAPILQEAEHIAALRRFLHWELEFPEVFFEGNGRRKPDGGFDAIIGNPPWDMVRADSGSNAGRSRAATASLVRFTRDSGIYSAQSDGHANSYQLFLERCIALTRPRGRIGLVLPSGLACDHGSARLRRQLFSQCAVEALVGFENRRRAFPIHRSVRFLLMTATKGAPSREIKCRFGETEPSALEAEADETAPGEWFPVRLTIPLLERLSGPDLAVPTVLAAEDVVIYERAATLFAPLGDSDGWNLHFGRELNKTDDGECLRAPGRGVRVVEGWQVQPFRFNLGASRYTVSARDAEERLGDRHRRARLAYRDVAAATNRVTLIAAILPAGCVTTHTLFCLRTPLESRLQHFLCGLFNSLVVNYLIRLRVGTHVTTSIVERLPIPPAERGDPSFHEIVALARMLARRDDPARKGRLDALVAARYRLTVDEFAHVLNTFPLIAKADRDLALTLFKGMKR
jgi:hypothetical protein